MRRHLTARRAAAAAGGQASLMPLSMCRRTAEAVAAWALPPARVDTQRASRVQGADRRVAGWDSALSVR
jgi:hypothetical protein